MFTARICENVFVVVCVMMHEMNEYGCTDVGFCRFGDGRGR